MNKQNKLILRVVKAALKMAEAAKKTEESKLDNRYGTSRRPMDKHFAQGGVFSPNADASPEPPTGKNGESFEDVLKKRGEFIIHSDPKEQGCEALGPFTSQFLNAQLEEIKRLKNPLKDFAGDDTPYVEKLLKPLGDTPRTLIHLKSPELGTETLVVLSPEGETLLKIVKDNSRKFEVR